jgi:putative iron-regulated protein
MFGLAEHVQCRAIVLISSFLAASLALSCRGRTEEVPAPVVSAVDARDVLQSYANIAFSAYTDSAVATGELVKRCHELATSPGAAELTAARKAWVDARAAYAQSEVFRFCGGPIDRVEFLVNTWPIDEEVIESTAGKTGLIDDVERYPVLSIAVLQEANGKGGETAVTTGFHAVEFLLWGRDTRADGPGDRTPLAFADKTPLGPRRARYLELSATLLQQNLEEVAAEWAPARTGNYRERLLSMPHGDALSLVVKGMGSLSGPELMGERLTVAYETKDQENEHSCFSDTTHTDIWLDAVGIQNVWLGHYQQLDGTSTRGRGLVELVGRANASLGATLTRQLEDSVARARAIPAPFDQAILGPDSQPGRRAIAATIAALKAQSDTLARLPAALGISLPLTAAGR